MIKKLSILFFLILKFSYAQHNLNTYNYINVELESVLNQIEEDFSIKFSYNPEWIKGVKVDFSLEKPSLSEVIVTLERQLHFLFNKLDDRYFTLKPINKLYVCGYLKEKNLTPFSGATVSNLSRKKMDITTNEGYFQLSDIDKNDTIEISSFGYKTKRIPAKSFFKKCEDFFLEEKFYALNEVVVKEYLSSSISLKNGGIVDFDLKKPDILAGQAEPDILQTVQVLPGVDNTTENAADLIIRGSSPDKNLILWDGIKLYNTDHFFGTLTNLNASLVNNVSIHKSGVSAKYGDRVSGIIDISLDKEVPKKIESSLGINLLNSDFLLKLPITKRLGFFISSRRSFTDFYNSEIFDNNFNRIFQNSRVNITRQVFRIDPSFKNEQTLIFEDHSAKLIYDLNEKHKFSGTFLFTNNKFTDEVSFFGEDAFGGFGTTFFDILKISNLGASFIYTSQWNDKLNTNLEVKYSDYDLEYLSFNFDRTFGFPFDLERSNKIKELTSNFNINYSLSKYWNILSGYELLNTRVKSNLIIGIILPVLDSDQKNKPTHSIYNQINFNKVAIANVNLGVRLTKFANFDQVKWEPRLNIEKKTHKNFRVRASAEIRHQSINRIKILSGFDTGEENEVWLPSIQDAIPLLKTKQVSLGAVFEKNNWVVDIETYYKKSEGLITFPPMSHNRFSNVPEEGEGTIKGIDFLVKKKVRNYTTWLGYTYATNKEKFENINNNRTFNSNNDIRHSLTWSHFLQWKKFQFSLGWKYRTGTPFTLIKELIRDPLKSNSFDILNGERTPDYHRLDFSVNYTTRLSKRDQRKSMKIGVALQNIYNRKNILNTQFSRFIASPELELALSPDPIRFDTESLGFTPNVFLRFNF